MGETMRGSNHPAPGEDGQHITYCRICEPLCGLKVTVKDGRVAAIAPDRDNPHSQGHACVKGVSFGGVVHDTDRVTRPLRRDLATGAFEPVSWDVALDDIAARLAKIRDRNGPEAIAFYLGNPSSFSVDAAVSHGGMMRAIGSRKVFSPGSQDSNARFVANFAAFGSALRYSFPDLPRCDFLLSFGANPLVSNGSLIYAPRIRHDLDAVAARGRVVIVDPRLTETARRYEHVQVRPNGDAWLLLAMLRTLFDEGLIDREAVAAVAVELAGLEAAVAQVDLARATEEAGVPLDAMRQLARDFVAARRAAAYGRVGICRGNFSSLTNFLLTALNVVAGKFAVPGGEVFGHTILAGSERGVAGGYGGAESRIGGIPAVVRHTPSAALADDIIEPGDGQVRALLVTAGNPLMSAPGGAKLDRALGELDLLVALDIYPNETARQAHYILPTTTFLERADFPFMTMNLLMRPFVQYTEAVITPVGEVRAEHWIYREIIRRMGLTWPTRSAEERDAEARGDIRPPIDRYDHMLREGPAGDGYGTRDGLSFDLLRRNRHGVMLDRGEPTDDWRTKLGYADGKVRLWHDLMAGEFNRLMASNPPPALSLIGRRDIRSINSWMHNIDRLVRSQRPRLLIHPVDAEAHGIATGDTVRVATPHDGIDIEAELSEEIAPGTLCYPHGWGHQGGWQTANLQPGKNVNMLLGTGPAAVEFVSGSTLIDGIAVTIERVAAA